VTRAAPDHVCIILLTGLGDVIHGLPVVNAMRRAWPRTRISWVVEPMPAGVLEPHPAIDQVIVFHKKRGLRGVLELRRRLRHESLRHRVQLQHLLEEHLSDRVLAGARALDVRPRPRTRGRMACRQPPPARAPATTHPGHVPRVRGGAWASTPRPLEWRLVITDAERAEQRRFIDELDGRRAIGIVPASANVKKDWPAERYIDVVNAIENDLGARAVLIGGPGARETHAARIITDGADTPPLRMMGDGVRRLIWLLDACAAAVAPDTGPLHIARALDTPVVGLFGHTNPWRVGPYRAGADLWLDAYTEPGEGAGSVQRNAEARPHGAHPAA
jgi:heptosyltransferase I